MTYNTNNFKVEDILEHDCKGEDGCDVCVVLYELPERNARPRFKKLSKLATEVF